MAEICPCSELDWSGHDLTAEHHPRCSRVVDTITHPQYEQGIFVRDPRVPDYRIPEGAQMATIEGGKPISGSVTPSSKRRSIILPWDATPEEIQRAYDELFNDRGGA